MSWESEPAGRGVDARVRDQVQHVLAPFSPYWRQRFADLGLDPARISGAAALEQVPAVGERDVSPAGDPAAMAALVVQQGPGGHALHAPGPRVRQALWARLSGRDAYAQLVGADTRPTSYAWSGLGFRYPLASTRGDLDALARAGARLWRVLGLSADDALLAAVPAAATTEAAALQYAALAAGAPAMFPGDAVDEVAQAARLAAPTVLAVRAEDSPTVAALAAEGRLDKLRTLLLVGAPGDAERDAARAAVGRDDVAVLAVHVPAGGRLPWAECRGGGAEAGLHTYPDLDLVQLVDPETGEPATGGGEVVLTQLGLRGSAQLRWRTGDVVAGLSTQPCPGCGRRVPRLVGVRRGVLVVPTGDGRALDLRAVAAALAGRPDLTGWRLVVGARARDGRGQVVVHLATAGEAGPVAVAAAGDIRKLAGLLPTQLVAGPDLAAASGRPVSARIVVRDDAGNAAGSASVVQA